MEISRNGGGILQLFILDTKTCRSIPLPNLPEGKFEVKDRDGGHLIFVIDGAADGWHISPAAPSALIGGQEIVLKPYHPIYLRAGAGNERWTLYPTAGTAASRAFARCLVPDDVNITVGLAGDNELICSHNYMGQYHLVLECQSRIWRVRCLDAQYGMYVNGIRCTQKTLRPGDLVSVLEQKLIVLPGLVAFNAPDGKTALRSGSRFQLLQPQHISPEEVFISTPIEDFFYRIPRFSEGMDNQSLTVDSPPTPHEPSQTNALLTMAPSLLTGVVSLAEVINLSKWHPAIEPQGVQGFFGRRQNVWTGLSFCPAASPQS